MTHKILLVDDSETLRSQLREILEKNSYKVVEGKDGIMGLEALRANQDISLIICDINMPNLDGMSMCQQIANDPHLPKVPIFMLTTESNPEMKEKGKKVGVRAWVTKPYNEEKLLAAIKKLTLGSVSG